MAGPATLNAHQRPPDSMRGLFKRVQKASLDDLRVSPEILDLETRMNDQSAHLIQHEGIEHSTLETIFDGFLGAVTNKESLFETPTHGTKSILFELKALPGLFVFPSLLPAAVQIGLLDKLLHRDLSNPVHQTNLDLHYHVPRETRQGREAAPEPGPSSSFFAADLDHRLAPKDPNIHKPLSMKLVLEKKIRWMTLGGQYNWTAKKYPLGNPPPFPEDIGNLLQGLFPDVDAQAAIVNFYSPRDTLSVHRDVSEECERGLISLSIGCDAIFIIGNDDGTESAALRLRSGDAVLMSGRSRFAWHAVPKVVPDTCPEWLQDWPSSAEWNHEYERWRGWLKNKRININVRQMRDGSLFTSAP